MQYINNDFQERSILESVAFQILMDTLLTEIRAGRIVKYMNILSLYHVHCDLVRHILRFRYNLNQAI